jgi:UDP-N-acetyl-D-mannosaminuronate dehydrogenase
MPSYTVSLLENIVEDISNAKVGVLGISYKGNVNDVRGSPGLKMKKVLEEKKASVEIFDPFVPEQSTVSKLDELLEKSDYIILATAHDEFLKINGEQLKKNGVKAIVDGRNCLDPKSIVGADVKYKGIGL